MFQLNWIYKNSQWAGLGSQPVVFWPLNTGLESALQGTNRGWALLGADRNKRQKENEEGGGEQLFFVLFLQDGEYGKSHSR